jgi:ATP synthase protein I
MAEGRLERPDTGNEQVSGQIGRKADRKLKVRQRQARGVWFGLGMFGLVGWAVAIPTVLGIALGLWLDGRFPGKVSWTVTLLFIGVVLGCLNAWFWVRRESRHED